MLSRLPIHDYPRWSDTKLYSELLVESQGAKNTAISLLSSLSEIKASRHMD